MNPMKTEINLDFIHFSSHENIVCFDEKDQTVTAVQIYGYYSKTQSENITCGKTRSFRC